VKVPEGTQHGRLLRLKGKAMPVLRLPNVGDLYIPTAVETPQNLSRRQRELLEEFEQLSSKDNSPQSSGFFSRMKDFFESFGEG
jgi:molecular chaperone DnaJ